MDYLKSSLSAERERNLRHACLLIAERSQQEVEMEKMSSPITSSLSVDKGASIPFFEKKHFGRG